MIKTINTTIKYLSLKPKMLFLIDSIGALLTTFFLLLIWSNFSEYFGMPKAVLGCLFVFAACLYIYSTTCYLALKQHWIAFIIGISTANLLYCILTMSLVILYAPILTSIGKSYFLVEVAVIFGLIYVELRVAYTIKKAQSAL